MGESLFSGKVGLQQRVLPEYRAAFFDLLAAACQRGLGVFAGEPRPQESIRAADHLDTAQYTRAHNVHLFEGPRYLCLQRGLMEWLAEWDPDVLIVEANPRLLRNPSAARWMQRRGRPVVGWGLGLPLAGRPRSLLRRWIRRHALHGLDAVIAYSTRGAEEYRALGFPARRVFVAPNAVVSAPSQPLCRTRSVGRPTRLLFVGRLQQRKRVDLLLRASASLPHPVEVWIVGDGPARTELERLASDIYPQARFLGEQHGSMLEDLFAQADVLVLPGTGGLAVQQGMAHGLPAIVAEGDGTQHDLVRPQNGWLIPEGDLAALCQALEDAVSDPEKLHAMGLESYRIVREEYGLEAMVRAFIRAIHAVLEEA